MTSLKAGLFYLFLLRGKKLFQPFAVLSVCIKRTAQHFPQENVQVPPCDLNQALYHLHRFFGGPTSSLLKLPSPPPNPLLSEE